MKVKFKYIPGQLAENLKALNVKEEDLFCHASDLYIGVHDRRIAEAIKEDFKYPENVSFFSPQKGSDMERYNIGVEIPFQLMSHNFKTKKG